jgi:hypothetical protein
MARFSPQNRMKSSPCLNTNKVYIHGKCREVMVLDATFNNISVITWRSVLLVEESGIPGENHQHVASH